MQTGEHEKVYSSQNEAFWGEQGDPRLTFKWLERSGGGEVRGRHGQGEAGRGSLVPIRELA